MVSKTVCSLVRRPHPLMRRNGLVNQVEFLGLAQAFGTITYSNIFRKTCLKKYGYLNGDEQIVRY